MDRTSWNTGTPRETEDMEYWRNVLGNRRLRSRFIRDLEVQSIGSRSLEDIARRSHDEELLTRQARSL